MTLLVSCALVVVGCSSTTEETEDPILQTEHVSGHPQQRFLVRADPSLNLAQPNNRLRIHSESDPTRTSSSSELSDNASSASNPSDPASSSESCSESGGESGSSGDSGSESGGESGSSGDSGSESGGESGSSGDSGSESGGESGSSGDSGSESGGESGSSGDSGSESGGESGSSGDSGSESGGESGSSGDSGSESGGESGSSGDSGSESGGESGSSGDSCSQCGGESRSSGDSCSQCGGGSGSSGDSGGQSGGESGSSGDSGGQSGGESGSFGKGGGGGSGLQGFGTELTPSGNGASGQTGDGTQGDGQFFGEAGDPNLEAPSDGGADSGNGQRGGAETTGGRADTGLETGEQVTPSGGTPSPAEEVTEVIVSGVVGGQGSTDDPNSSEQGFLDDAPRVLMEPEPAPDPQGESDGAANSSSTHIDDSVFLQLDREEILLGELEVEVLDIEAVDESPLVTAADQPIDILSGAWRQVSAHSDPDFAPGGTDRRVIAINNALETIHVYCVYGDVVRLTVSGAVGFQPGAEFSIILQDAPDTGRAFDLSVRPAPGGGNVMPPTLVPGDELTFEPLDNIGQRIRLGDRVYERIDGATFEEIRRGNIKITAPKPPAASADGSSAGTNASQPEFFGIRATGRHICFICDGSGSMSMYFERLKKELVTLVGKLPRNTHFVVMFFSGTTMGSLDWEKGGTKAAKVLEQQLNSTFNGGGSDPTSAIKIAFEDLDPVPDTVFLMTDGQITPSTPQLIARLNGGKLRSNVHTIFFGAGSGSQMLKKIAKDNAGSFRAITTP